MNYKFMVIFLTLFFLVEQAKRLKEAWRRGSTSREHAKGKWAFSMKPADKQLTFASSVSIILD